MQRALIAQGWQDDVENSPLLNYWLSEVEETGCNVVGSTPDRPVGEDFETTEAVEAWLRKLPPKHAEACRQIYLFDKSQGEAAEVVGCSKSRLSNLHKESIGRLKEAWLARSEDERDAAALTRRSRPTRPRIRIETDRPGDRPWDCDSPTCPKD